MNVVILELKKPLPLSKSLIAKFCDDYSRFAQEYNDSWIIMIPEKVIMENKAYMFFSDELWRQY